MNTKSMTKTVRAAALLCAFCLVLTLTAVSWQTAVQAQAGLANLTATNAYPALTFSLPVDIVHAGDERLFIVEKAGVIRVAPLAANASSSSVFLNLSAPGGPVEADCNECGLLGLAFHPQYQTNGRFFVNYTHTTPGGQLVTRVSEFSVSGNPNVASPGSEIILLQVDQPFQNHNAGDLAFGPDGLLYVTRGDGGSGGDPQDNAQDPTNLLGAILRLDVDGRGLPPDCDPDGGYTIPADNPFVASNDSRCNEIWSFGLRNPWRIGFDQQNGDLFIGDVGQNAREEIDFQSTFSSGGENYGWNCYEGSILYTGVNSNPNDCAPASSYTAPIFDYTHTDDGSGVNYGRSVTGGTVYRGELYPGMAGHYLLADYISGNFWSLTHDGSGWANSQATAHGQLSGVANPSTFGEDVYGELYVASYTNGRIYQLGDGSPRPDSIRISKSGPAAVFGSDDIIYTISVTNLASTPVSNVVMTDTLPIGSTYVTSNPAGSVSDRVITWRTSTLGGRESLTFSLTITPGQKITRNEIFGVVADGVAPSSDPQPVVTILDPEQIFMPLVSR